MNWQTVLMIYCFWMMGVSIIGLIKDKKNMDRYFEQGERILMDQDLRERTEKIIKRIEQELEDMGDDLYQHKP